MTRTPPQPLTQIECPLCGNPESFDVMRVQDWLVTQNWFTLMECPRCTGRFIQPFPREDELPAYYQSEAYISHTDTKKGLINRLYRLARKETLRSKRRRIEKASGLKKGKLLDIGAATGHFLHTMQKAGWDVCGVEPDESARKRAKDHFGLTLFPQEDLKSLTENTFDVITLWHVLEHIHDLHGTLEQIKRLLKPSGILVVAVPNYLSYDARYYGKHWAAWDPPRHLYHFTPEAMKQLMASNKLRITSQKRMPLDSFYVSLLSEKIHKHNSPIRGLTVGKISWLKSLFQPEKCSSITYFGRVES